VTQTGVVARLAVRELWISFRLLLLLVAFVGAGTVVALAPAPLPATVERLAIGLAVATAVGAGIAAWSMAEERRTGRAGWLVSRSVSRGTLLAGWFVALASTLVAALVAAGALGWLTVSSVSLRLEPVGFTGLLVAIGATALAGIALGLLLGCLLPQRAAALAAVALCGGSILFAALLPADPTLVPGGAYAALAALVEPGGAAAPGIRATGIGLFVTAILLVAARVALDRVEL
jgi:hypothetical protein